jgi:hypothetical protein
VKGKGTAPFTLYPKCLLEAVKQHRKRLQTAKAEWEASRGKFISDSTLRRFLKVLAENING